MRREEELEIENYEDDKFDDDPDQEAQEEMPHRGAASHQEFVSPEPNSRIQQFQ